MKKDEQDFTKREVIALVSLLGIRISGVRGFSEMDKDVEMAFQDADAFLAKSEKEKASE